ncbi:hypothetical protein AVEN_17729-1 [Araneus ventricosus]|uniref:Uncharacterized protein n=1 Tax=Araneus ventricosus TaxID=182803 RepID=A0A4Y2FCU8_ARAVE|nr:hypothetical protein AVEN_17729-1 [Araneus ventricosus]
MQNGRDHHASDNCFSKFKDLHNKLQLTNRERNVLNEKVAFQDSVKWIRVEELGSYLYKDCYDPYIPFKKKTNRKFGALSCKGQPIPDKSLQPKKVENIE